MRHLRRVNIFAVHQNRQATGLELVHYTAYARAIPFYYAGFFEHVSNLHIAQGRSVFTPQKHGHG